jgi:hypothetical protein
MKFMGIGSGTRSAEKLSPEGLGFFDFRQGKVSQNV